MDNGMPKFIVVEWWHGTESYEITISSNGKRFQIYFTKEGILGPEGDETLLNKFHDFEKIMEDDEDASKAFEDWMVKPCASCIKRLAPPIATKKIPMLSVYLNPKTFVFELKNVGGRCEATLCRESTNKPSRPAFIVPMSKPIVSKAINRGTPCIPASQLVVVLRSDSLEVDYDEMPTKVRRVGNDTQYHFKCAFSDRAFAREIAVLLDIKGKFPHDNLRVSKLAGFAACDDGNSLAGLLVEYLHGSQTLAERVYNQESSKTQRNKWGKQVRDTVKQLHDADIVWGDVQPYNVLIDSNDDAWVIDFGGGFVRGWIDGKLAETKEGDLQGLATLDRFLEIGNGSLVDCSVEVNLQTTKQVFQTHPNTNEHFDVKAAQTTESQSEGRHSPVDSGIGAESNAGKEGLQTHPNTNEQFDIKASKDVAPDASDSKTCVDSDNNGYSKIAKEDLQSRCNIDDHDALHNAGDSRTPVKNNNTMKSEATNIPPWVAGRPP